MREPFDDLELKDWLLIAALAVVILGCLVGAGTEIYSMWVERGAL